MNFLDSRLYVHCRLSLIVYSESSELDAIDCAHYARSFQLVIVKSLKL